jgi:hypothetical protein
MALALVLVLIAVLVSVTAVAGASARRGMRQAEVRASEAVARAMAENAVIATQARLEAALFAARDSATVDAVLEAATEGSARGVGTPFVADSLAGGGFAAVVVDVSARLDVNRAGADGLTRLFQTVAPPSEAARVARAIAARVEGMEGVEGPGAEAPSPGAPSWARDSLTATLLGRPLPPRRWRPFETLDALQALPEVAAAPWLASVAEELTVDGDGRINRRRASARVLAAASGTLVDRPARLLVIGRGWATSRGLTREIQAVYDVAPPALRLVTWREQPR